MSKYWKTGLLIFLLIGPVLFFLFLKFFGTNRFDIPRYYPEIDSLTGNVRVMNGDTVFRKVVDWNLQDTTARRVTEACLNGRFSLIYAPDSLGSFDSRAAMVIMDRVTASLDSIPEVQLLWIVNSPNSLLGKELNEVGYKGRPALLTGNAGSISTARNTVFRGRDSEPDFDANSVLVLIDEVRVIRGYFDLKKETELDRLLAEIRILKHNKQSLSNKEGLK